MRLADHYVLVVEEGKVRGYLLNAAHPDGGPKARFFRGLGYGSRRWRSLADSLKQHAEHNDVADIVESAFGTKHIVIGPIESIDEPGANPEIVSVWITERGSPEARLVTAYPMR
jgi:hypothetical protein